MSEGITNLKHTKMNWINIKDKLPSMNEEYLVVWDLDDNQHPVVTSMDFDTKRKCFTDPRGTNTPMEEDKILFWMELPEPPKLAKAIYDKPEPLISETLDDFERQVVYGQCTHGENLARCQICNPNG